MGQEVSGRGKKEEIGQQPVLFTFKPSGTRFHIHYTLKVYSVD